MPKGIVKWFDPDMRYGFIVSEDGTDIFVHRSGIVYSRFKTYLKKGAEVTYEVAETSRGKKAIKVRVAN